MFTLLEESIKSASECWNIPGMFWVLWRYRILHGCSWDPSNVPANAALLAVWGSPYFCLKHTLPGHFGFFPWHHPASCSSASLCHLSRSRNPMSSICGLQGKGEHCRGNNSSWHSTRGVGNLPQHLLLTKSKPWDLSYVLSPERQASHGKLAWATPWWQCRRTFPPTTICWSWHSGWWGRILPKESCRYL